MLVNFLSALALVFIFEGIMPFAFPARWKKLLRRIAEKDERTLGILGFFSMMMGVACLTLIRQFID